MKNIHLILTDQPSRLQLNVNTGKLILFDNIQSDKESVHLSNQNIYITSSEEIRRNDYYIHNNRVRQSAGGEQEKGDYKNCKKIILTTDPTLIADGVQSIDDEFLEWFVKNPTCEHVDVFQNWNYHLDKSWEYEIIIPQEEPKQVICRDKFDRVIQNGYYVDVQDSGIHKVYRKEDGHLYFKPYGEEERVSSYFSNDLILTTIASKNIADLKKEITNKKQEEPKQETVEEAAEKWVFETNGHKWSNDDDSAGDNYGSFREGAKWMLEKLQDFDTWKEWKDINFK
jgi:hypothetical protein